MRLPDGTGLLPVSDEELPLTRPGRDRALNRDEARLPGEANLLPLRELHCLRSQGTSCTSAFRSWPSLVTPGSSSAIRPTAYESRDREAQILHSPWRSYRYHRADRRRREPLLCRASKAERAISPWTRPAVFATSAWPCSARACPLWRRAGRRERTGALLEGWRRVWPPRLNPEQNVLAALAKPRTRSRRPEGAAGAQTRPVVRHVRSPRPSGCTVLRKRWCASAADSGSRASVCSFATGASVWTAR